MARSAVRHLALLATLALTAAGCGLTASPVVSSEAEVLDALLALRDGAQVRASASIAVDEDEVRDALRDDPEALELLRDATDGSGDDVASLLDDVRALQEQLDDHALLLATGADGSVRIAGEYQGEAWVDLRIASDLAPGDDPAEGFTFDVQAQVDWEAAARALDQPELTTSLTDVRAGIEEFLGPDAAAGVDLSAVRDLALGFIDGDLVGIGGQVTADMVEALGGLTGLGDLGVTGTGATPLDGLDPRAALEAALSFGDFRRDGDDTLVTVSIEVRDAATWLLDRIDEAPDAFGMTFEDVEEARAEIADLPTRLADVATLTLGADGAVRQLRVDVLDLALQAAEASEDEDEELAAVARVLGALDDTGLFVVLDVTGIGTTDTVLGEPTASVTPEQLVELATALWFGQFGGTSGEFPLVEDEAWTEEFDTDV